MTTATQTQIRRDTATNLNAATPASGELGYDTTNKRLVVGDGSTAGGTKIPNAKDIQNQTFVFPSVGGTGDVITATNSPAKTALANGQKTIFKAGANNTTNVTLNEDSLGAKAIKKMRNGALADLIASDIVSGGIYEVFYDGTQYQIKGLSEGPYTSGALVFLASYTASASAHIDITSIISSTYDDYMIILSGVTAATGGANMQIQASLNNGSTFSGGSYSGSGTELDPMPGVDLNATSGNGVLHVLDVNVTPRFIGTFTTGGGTASLFGGAWSGGVLNALRFKMTTGNISAGTFKIYGIAKS